MFHFFAQLPMMLTYVLVLLIAREVWSRRRPFPQHRRGVALGVAWERHTGVTAEITTLFPEESDDESSVVT